MAWCERINTLADEERSQRWHYVLLSEDLVVDWHDKGATLAQLLNFARLRPAANAAMQDRLL